MFLAEYFTTRAVIARPLDLDRVRRAVDVLDLDAAFDRDVDLQLLHRVRGVLGRAQREQEIGQPVVLPQSWL